jgi:hypothetical protein
MRETQVAAQYQEDLPPVQPVVRRFDIHIGTCQGCQRRVQGRHPLQTSDALGAAGVQLGPHAIALAVQLNKQFGVSFGKIATLFRQRFGLQVTASAVVRALHRVAAKGQPTYEALCETVRTRAVVVPDETGWKLGGRLHWLWVFTTTLTTVYRICPGRGFAEAASVLGADFAGGLSRDGWAPYRQFTHAFHQTCRGICSDVVDSCNAIIRARAFRRASRGSCTTRSPCGIAARPASFRRPGWMSRAGICSTNSSPRLTRPGRSQRCSASRGISRPSCPRSSASWWTRPSTPRIGAPSKRYAPR